MNNVACKIRIHPTKEQEKFLRSNIGACRFVWNMLVDLQEYCYEATGGILSEFDCNKYVTSLRKTRRFLRDADSHSLQLVSKHLSEAFKSFFKSLKSGVKRGLPRKKNKFARKSYTTRESIVRIEGKRIVLPKVGAVRCDWKKLPPANRIQKINSATISLDGNRFYVSLQYKTADDLSWQKTGRAVGIDLGIKTLVTCSDGKTYENPHELKKAEKRLKHLQRAVDRRKNTRKKSKEAGSGESRRLQRARLKLQRRHAKVRNRRKDRIEYITSKILHANDVVCMEDLNTQGMMKNHHLAKAVADASFGMIRQAFERKAKTRGKKIVLVSRWFPSSQICSVCGARTGATKNLAVRSWACPSCGVVHDRDLNASVNILNEGLRILDTEADALPEPFRQGTAAQARRRNVRGGHTGVPNVIGTPPSDEAHSSAQGVDALR